ncbi:uncharacterized protein LOC123200782 [Mangifera indica]|uniref:uncharacterized protein LOC123200782 n=1 Tax=Mangifera indica TaxID=29780 RepID=UPI001CFA88FB|nr:uncharacterized protein LOC123200782 [Mangifera indica]XP_044472096.1 uncharacterized protein LOC123200782 [Mangifera indica]
MFQKFHSILNSTKFTRFKTLNLLYRNFHVQSKVGFNPQNKLSTSEPKPSLNNVGIFWDLDNKPPKAFAPFEAAIKLKKTLSSFGVVGYMAAYANSHAFSYVPQVVREQRKERKSLDQLEKKNLIKPVEPYLCHVCGRRFFANEKLVNHFKQIHEREHKKRLNQIESARGKRRLNLVAKYSVKMEKYKRAAREVLTPKVGYGLADELERAGFWVRMVPDKPQAADVALRNHMVDMMDKRKIECLVLVSDDSDFVDVLKEAKLRCLRTVVVGDINDGALKRVADAGFSWRDILMGKAKKEAISVVGKWKDRDILNRLEWTYNPEVEKKRYQSDDDSEDVDFADITDDNLTDCIPNEDGSAWWELGSSDE